MISPSGDATVARISETPGVSGARLEFGGQAGSFVPQGTITFSGGFCAAPPCPIVFQGFELTSAAPFLINGSTVTALRITNSGRLDGFVSSDGTITITTPAPFDASGKVGSALKSRRAVPSFDLAHLSRDSRELRMNGEVVVTGPEVGSATFDLVARFDDTAPVPIIDALTPAECGLVITMSAMQSFDPDGDAITAYSWFEDRADQREPLGTGPSLRRAFQSGFHRIGLHVSDSRGRGDFAFFGLTVVDTQPPVIDSLEVSHACLWPPNHKLTPLLLGSGVITSARDVCDGVPTISFAGVSSTQPVDGAGDGATSPDWIVAEAGNAICLRAERAGPVRDGRIYRPTVVAVDRAGNSSMGEVEIVVAHDQRPSARCATLSPDAFVTDTDPRCAVLVPVGPPPRTMGCQTTGNGVSCFPGLGFLVLIAACWRSRLARPARAH